MPRAENAALFRRYQALADAMPDVTFVGRLATYRYYNMDQVVAQALSTYARMVEGRGPRSALPRAEHERRARAGGSRPAADGVALPVAREQGQPVLEGLFDSYFLGGSRCSRTAGATGAGSI